MPRPRIMAHLVQYPPFRRIGAELATHALLRHLAGSGWDAGAVPRLVRPAGWAPFEAEGVQVVPPSLGNCVRPDVLLHHAAHQGITRSLADRYSCPVVMSVHGGDPGWACAHVSAVAPDLVLANSATMAYSLQRTGRPMEILRPPVFPNEHRIDTPGEGAAVTLVNLTEEKGAGVFYGLAKALPDLPFLGVRGGYGVQMIEDLPNVTIVDPQADMRWVWERTRVLIMPSWHETWGMAAVEAMAAEIPVIGSDTCPGLAEALGPGADLLPPHDVAAWVERVAALYDDRWDEGSIRSIRRSAELHPFADLQRVERALRALTGKEREPMGNVIRFYNHRTEDTVETEEGDATYQRLKSLPDVWRQLEEDGATRSPEAAAGQMPKRTDPKSYWVDHAVRAGADRAMAEKATKNALIALYGDGSA